MTIATTNVAFSAIQTEFGGANPVSVSEYLKGGAYVPSNQTTSATDGNAIPTTAANVRIGMFRGLTKTVGGSYDTTTYTGLRTTSTTGSFTANFTLQTDGSITTNTDAGTGSWWTPTTVGIGNAKYFRYSTTGSATLSNPGGLTAGTWYLLNTTRTLGATTSGVSFRTRSFTLDFSNDGSTVAATKTVNMQVETGNTV